MKVRGGEVNTCIYQLMHDHIEQQFSQHPSSNQFVPLVPINILVIKYCVQKEEIKKGEEKRNKWNHYTILILIFGGASKDAGSVFVNNL